ncbi:hypothetical protein [Chamaesiphon sp. GL140_3_metabinner_50]|nr:hypothetical protein [Chamaesiphon sp. GL140_3_metabinner_50]
MTGVAAAADNNIFTVRRLTVGETGDLGKGMDKTESANFRYFAP